MTFMFYGFSQVYPINEANGLRSNGELSQIPHIPKAISGPCDHSKQMKTQSAETMNVVSSSIIAQNAKIAELEREKAALEVTLQMFKNELEAERRFRQGSLNLSQATYGAVLDICSFTKLSEIGLKWTSFRADKGSSHAFLAVLGNKLTGKSFMISKLLNLELPRGFSKLHKPDIAVVFPVEGVSNCSALDCRGFDDEFIRDRYGIDTAEAQFITSLRWKFACYCANVIVIMVDQFRTTEQAMIKRVAEHCGGKQLLVVHNLMQLMETVEVEQYIESLTKDYGLRVFQSDTRILISSVPNDGIRHLFIAREESQAGIRYNDQTRSYLINLLSIQTEAGGFMLARKTAEFLSKILPHYLANPFSIVIEEKELQSSTSIKLTSQPVLKPLQFPEMEAFSVNAKHPYDFRIVGDELVLRVELPGIPPEHLNSFQVEQQSDKHGILIHIAGSRPRPTTESVASTITYGHVDIVIPPIKCPHVPEGVKAKLSYQDGMLSCTWKIYRPTELTF